MHNMTFRKQKDKIIAPLPPPPPRTSSERLDKEYSVIDIEY